MKKYLLTFLTLGLLLCEASFTGGGMAFAATSYTLSSGVLTITGTGAMTDYSSSTGMPWNSDKTSVTSIIINEGVTTIGDRAFFGCSNATSVEISSTVTSIGQYAFSGCSKLGTIKFGTSTDYQCNIDTIKGNAFSSCSAVNKVYCYGSDADNAMARWLNIGFNATTSSPFYASTVTSKYFYLNGSSKTSITISGDQVKPYAFYKSPVSTVTLNASVKTIGTSAFDGSKLTTLNFSENAELTTISTRAFAACTSLKTPTLPISLTTIAGNAFNGCTSTNFKSITIPENVTICGDGVFTGCSQLNTVVWNAKNCTTYDGTNPYKSNYGPFYNGTVKGQITSFTFGDAVEVIPLFCCYNMPNITLLTVPASVESIGEKAFSGCTGLTAIVAEPVDPSSCGTNAFESVNKDIPVVLTSPTSVADYRSAGGWSDFTNISNTLSGSCGTNATWTLNLAMETLTISGTGAISNYTSNSPAPWNDYITYISDIVINSGITTLGERCFASCDVETLNIPASVIQIESQSFLSAKANKLYYGGTLSNWCAITMGAYNTLPQTQELYINSSKITSLVLPNIASLGTKAFMNMKGITSVTIPASLTTIGADAFSGCSNLTDVYFQGTLAQWCAINFSNDQEANPAYNGASLHITDSDIDGATVVVKDAITSISNYAFCGVNNYESIEINAETTIGTYTFKNCTAQILYRGSASGTSGNVSWTWNNGVLTLTGTGTMNNYTTTPNAPWSQYMPSTTSIIVSEGITSIGDYAFYATAAPMVTLSLPSTLTSIGKSVGYGLKDLRVLIIPDAVTTIGTSAFSSCTNLEKIYCPATRPTLNKDYGAPKYTNFPSNKSFYVTASSYSSQYAGQWTDFSPQWFAYGDCGASGDNLTFIYEVATGTLTISGTGAMANYATASAMPWNSFKTSITSLVIEDGVTTIGNRAFYGCTALASTSIASSCTTFGMYAFSGCTSLSEVILHEGITSMGSYVFSGCSNLSNVTLPSTLTEVSPRAFENTGLTEIDIPEGVITLNNYAFYNCTSLESVQLPSTLVNINYNVFDGCTSLSDITLPEGLAKIDIYAFQNCSNLASINIPNTVTTINHDAFSGCSKLASVTYGDAPTLATIGYYAFKNCTTLTSITIPVSVTSIDCTAGQSQIKSTFYGCTGLRTVVWNAANCGNFTYAYYNGNSHNYYTPFYNIWGNITSFIFGPEVEHIPAYLCYGMNNASLTSITMPASVETIGGNAFTGCSNVTMVTCNATTPPEVASNSLSDITGATLVVPGASKADYVAADYWKDFYRILPYVVQFDLNGHGSAEIADEYVGYGGRIETAPYDTETGYTFGGWYQEEGCTTPFTFGESGTVVNADMTLYAKWTANNYYITYKDKGDDVAYSGSNIGSLPATHTYDAATELVDGVKTGYTFDGWFANSDCTGDAVTSLGATDYTDDITLYAKWTINQYTVSFDSNGGSEVTSIMQDYNSAVTAPADPTKTGYTFAGWSPAVPSTMPAENIECVAQWNINQYTISFDSNGGSAVASITQDYSSAVTAPADPTKTGYTFAGWSPAVPSTMPAENIECVAQWTINNYTVSFNLQGHGTAIAAQSVDYNGTASQPADPEADYFTFGGWFDNEGCTGSPFDFSTPITADLTLYALWTENIFSFADTDNNTAKILAANGKLASSITIGRTIWRDGYYNSMCLPFSLTSEQLAASPLAGYKALKRLSEATITGEDENRELNIQLEPITEITAGEPFFISYEVGLNITNPEFTDVTVTAPAPNAISKGDVTCRGLYTSTDLGTATTNLFLGANNVLYWPAEGQSTIKGLRAYFVINPGAPAKSGMRVRLSDKPAEVPTALEETNLDSRTTMHKYIRDGVLFIERDGKTYNAQGVLVH